MKPRTCPHCLVEIPFDYGFHFDENLNLIHDQCGKIVFSSTPMGDNAMTIVVTQGRQSSYRPSAFSPATHVFVGGQNGYDMDV